MAEFQRGHSIELKVPSDLNYERIVRATARSVAQHMGFAQDRIDALGTAVGEACSNAIKHGNRSAKELSVQIRFDMQTTGLLVEITDFGKGFTPPPSPDIAAQLTASQERGGWGIYLMQKLVDQVSFHINEQGEHLTRLYLFRKDSQCAKQGDGH